MHAPSAKQPIAAPRNDCRCPIASEKDLNVPIPSVCMWGWGGRGWRWDDGVISATYVTSEIFLYIHIYLRDALNSLDIFVILYKGI